ncbi:MAG: hypothetical protein H7330_14095 [Hymenobacteraceae bacterium]|nr:hypothetical protein [Hymenobacteraceae bacterium]
MNQRLLRLLIGVFVSAATASCNSCNKEQERLESKSKPSAQASTDYKGATKSSGSNPEAMSQPVAGSTSSTSSYYFRPSYLVVLDSTGFNIIPAKTCEDFVKQQAVVFRVSSDTIFNDERGVAVGKRLTYRGSYLQWEDDKTVSRMEVVDPEIKLNHKIYCQMTKAAFIKATQFDVSKCDTFELQSGFLENGILFYFTNGKLSKISLENLSD